MVAPLVAEHRLEGAPASVAEAGGPSSCDSQALELRLSSCGISVWHLPGSGLERVSLASAGRFFVTETPGSPYIS